jgi:hypothetical protein
MIMKPIGQNLSSRITVTSILAQQCWGCKISSSYGVMFVVSLIFTFVVLVVCTFFTVLFVFLIPLV